MGALKEEKRHKEALIVLEQYLKNKEETIKYTIENGLYKTTIKLCSNLINQDVIGNICLLFFYLYHMLTIGLKK